MQPKLQVIRSKLTQSTILGQELSPEGRHNKDVQRKTECLTEAKKKSPVMSALETQVSAASVHIQISLDSVYSVL